MRSAADLVGVALHKTSTKKKVKWCVVIMSFVQVMSHSGGGLGSDRTPFYGIKVPAEVKSLAKLCKTLEHGLLKQVLKGQ